MNGNIVLGVKLFTSYFVAKVSFDNIVQDGKTLIDRRSIEVARDVFVDSGLQPTEYQTMPLLAEALATEIAHALLDTW